MSERRIIGVLGGLGPAATADFVQRVVSHTPAATDQEHVHLVVDSNPTLPNRNDAIAGRGPSPGPVLALMARGLEAAGAQTIVMVCNTAHAFQDDITGALKTARFTSLIELTLDEVESRGPSVDTIGILATEGCLEADLYGRAARARGLDCVKAEPEEERAFMALLYRIKAGRVGSESQAEMKRLAMCLVERGAELIVAACTEVPLVLTPDALPVPFVSSTDALVDFVVREGTGRSPS